MTAINAAVRAMPLRHLSASVKKLRQGSVLIVGDVMVDEYLLGDAERISPEAPVPVVRVTEDKLVLGGAGNVARNISALGGGARLIGVVGEDAGAERVRDLLGHSGLSADCVVVPGRPTTIKTRIIAQQQQMLRVDREMAAPLAAPDVARLLERIAAVLADYSVLVISDYGKGLVSKELLDGIRKLCISCARPPLLLVDPKTPNFHLYTGAYMLTPNAKETSEGAQLPARNPEEIVRAGQEIFRKLSCAHLLTTLGSQGMALFLSPQEVWHIPTTAQKVFDVTGAGDTVIAAASLGLSAGLDLLDACVLANYAAGIVVGEVGAAVAGPKALHEALHTLPVPTVTRWL